MTLYLYLIVFMLQKKFRKQSLACTKKLFERMPDESDESFQIQEQKENFKSPSNKTFKEIFSVKILSNIRTIAIWLHESG